jgi:hypothetical protein
LTCVAYSNYTVVTVTETRRHEMIRPTKYPQHAALLTPELLAEKEWLTKNWRLDAPGRKERAEAYNAKCKDLGATLMMMVVS